MSRHALTLEDPQIALLKAFIEAEEQYQKEQAELQKIVGQAQSNEHVEAFFKRFEPIPAFDFLTKTDLGAWRWRYAFGGRGTAKSWQFVDAAIYHACRLPGLRVAFVREIQATLKESSMELVRSRLEHWGLLETVFREANGEFVGPGGSKILFIGLWKSGKPSGIKSLEGIGLTILEEAQEISAKSLEALVPTVARREYSEIWALWNPRSKKDAVDELLRGPFPPDRSIGKHVVEADNPYFPEALKEQRELAFKRNPIRARHIWEGDYEPTAEGAMWTRELLDQAIMKGSEVIRPQIKRVVIGVDPAGGGGDEIGIVAVAELHDGTACVLGDHSCKPESPAFWGARVRQAVEGWSADMVAAESNFGGDMVKANLINCGVTCRIAMVPSSRGKHLRAEPIAGLYENGKIAHLRAFPELEEQMLHMTPQGYALSKSPDRLDAMVFAATEIFGTSRPASAKLVRKP